MKLRIINETVLFHGTSDPEQVLKTGLKVNSGKIKRNSIYLGSLWQALAYGGYIVEVNVGEKEEILADEDAILSLADPTNPNWVR